MTVLTRPLLVRVMLAFLLLPHRFGIQCVMRLGVYVWIDEFFFFQAEDGIRDLIVTGVQTCALPISRARERAAALPAGPAPTTTASNRSAMETRVARGP